jgi:hypothetical protein
MISRQERRSAIARGGWGEGLPAQRGGAGGGRTTHGTQIRALSNV